MNDILNGLNLEPLWYMYLGDSLVFQTKGFSTNGASEVDVLAQFVVMGALSIETNVHQGCAAGRFRRKGRECGR